MIHIPCRYYTCAAYVQIYIYIYIFAWCSYGFMICITKRIALHHACAFSEWWTWMIWICNGGNSDIAWKCHVLLSAFCGEYASALTSSIHPCLQTSPTPRQKISQQSHTHTPYYITSCTLHTAQNTNTFATQADKWNILHFVEWLLISPHFDGSIRRWARVCIALRMHRQPKGGSYRWGMGNATDEGPCRFYLPNFEWRFVSVFALAWTK